MVLNPDLTRLFHLRRAASGKVADLRRSPLFADLSAHELEVIAAHLDEVTVPAGTVLVREGRRNHAFWLVVDGLAAVSIQGRPRRLIGAGGHFGATSMLDGLEASATVVARTPVRALVAGVVQFGALTGNATVAARIRCESEKRLRSDLRDLVAAS